MTSHFIRVLVKTWNSAQPMIDRAFDEGRALPQLCAMNQPRIFAMTYSTLLEKEETTSDLPPPCRQ
jgi:hypothetical protein